MYVPICLLAGLNADELRSLEAPVFPYLSKDSIHLIPVKVFSVSHFSAPNCFSSFLDYCTHSCWLFPPWALFLVLNTRAWFRSIRPIYQSLCPPRPCPSLSWGPWVRTTSSWWLPRREKLWPQSNALPWTRQWSALVPRRLTLSLTPLIPNQVGRSYTNYPELMAPISNMYWWFKTTLTRMQCNHHL